MRASFAVIFLLISVSVCFAEVTIPANTIIPVRATESIEGRGIKPGQEIVLVVATNIKINGEYVVKAGAPVIAFVSDASNAQMAGISGKIALTLRSTLAVDGSTIPLSGQMLNSGDSEVGSTVAAGAVLCPLALLNKGKSGRIAPGMEVRAMTVGDVIVDTANPIEIEYRSVEFVADPQKEDDSGDSSSDWSEEF